MKNKEILTQARFINVDGLGLVMTIKDFNELISKFKPISQSDIDNLSDKFKNSRGGKSELQRALIQRREAI